MEKVSDGEISRGASLMLSIVVDDFDSQIRKEHVEKSTEVYAKNTNTKEPAALARTSDRAIKKILDEVEHRKDEFRKLLDEHNAVIQNLKKIEKQEDTNIKNSATKARNLASPMPN